MASSSAPAFSVKTSRSLNLGKAAIYVFVLCDLLIRSRLYEFVSDAFRTAMLGIILSLILSSAIIAFFRRMFVEAALFASLMVMFSWELYHFSALNAASFNVNAMAQLYGPLSYIFFVQFRRRDAATYYAGATLMFGLPYLCLYCVLAVLNFAGHLPRVVLDRMAMNDSMRGVRVFLASDIAALVFFVSFKQNPRRVLHRISLIVAGIASVLSLSRFYLLILALTTLLSKFGMLRLLPVIMWTIFTLESALLIYGVLDPSFNPFSSFASDDSGWVRSVEYDLARQTVWRDPLSGVGFPSSDTELASAVSSGLYSTSDIGAINVWSVFGFFGLLFYLFSGVPLSRAFNDRERATESALHLTGCLILGLNAIAPLSLINPGSLVFGCCLAAWLRNPRGLENPMSRSG